MPSERDHILHWAEAGRVGDDRLRDALGAAGVLPDRAAWRRFIDLLLLGFGIAGLGAGLIFFLAYNWDALGRFAKFALVQAPLLGCLALIWRRGLDGAAGRSALMLAALLVGALLALIGQTYQTGADPYQLFLAWALAVLPWAMLGRLPALWLLWLLVTNVGLALYLEARGLRDLLDSPQLPLWPHVALNLLALAAWEVGAVRGLAWLRERWAPRLINTVAGSLLTWLLLWTIVDADEGRGAALIWPLWLLGCLGVYLRLRRDLFMVAGVLLAAIIVVCTLLGRLLLDEDLVAGLLAIGLALIGLSAAAATWLRRLAAEEDAA